MKGCAGSAWPTAVKSDVKGANASGSDTASAHSLATKAELLWPTATPMQTRDGWSKDDLDAARQKAKAKAGNGNGFGLGLGAAASAWTTPQAHDVRMRGAGQTSGATGSKAGNRCLATDALTWGTPRASDAEKGGPNQAFGAGGTPLPAQAAQWPTPMAGTPAQNGNSAAGNNDFSRKADILAAGVLVSSWPTPAAQNVKGSSEGSITRADGKSRMDILHYRAEQGFSHPDPETQPHGPTLSQLRRILRPLRGSLIASHGRATWRRLWNGRTKRRLNPIFVEWLMGWPPGHALCDCSATEFIRWQQHMRGALSQLPTASGPWIWAPPKGSPKPVQIEMFGG